MGHRIMTSTVQETRAPAGAALSSSAPAGAPTTGLGRRPRGGAAACWRRAASRAYPYLLVAPSCLFLVVVFFYPIGFSVHLSLRNIQLFELTSGGRFAGLGNYAAALRDPMVWNSFGRTLLFVIGAVSLELVLGFAIALFLNQRMPARRLLRSVALLPLMLTPVVLGITFRILLNYTYGVVNYALGLVRIDPIIWLASTPWAMISVIATDVWNQTPFVTLLLLAGLQAIPEEHYEAARVDGAGAWRRLLHVTLPMLAPVIFVAVFWRFVATFRVFDIVFVMTGGGPAESTETLSILVSKLAFNYARMGYAATVSLGMVLFMMAFAIVYYRTSRAARGESE